MTNSLIPKNLREIVPHLLCTSYRVLPVDLKENGDVVFIRDPDRGHIPEGTVSDLRTFLCREIIFDEWSEDRPDPFEQQRTYFAQIMVDYDYSLS